MADIKKKLKMALISGAAHALKFKAENKYTNDDEIIQQVSRDSNSILSKLDSGE